MKFSTPNLNLMYMVGKKFLGKIVIFSQDEENDWITIDSQTSLEKAINRFKDVKTVKIKLVNAKVNTTTSMSFGAPSMKRKALENSLEVVSSKKLLG